MCRGYNMMYDVMLYDAFCSPLDNCFRVIHIYKKKVDIFMSFLGVTSVSLVKFVDYKLKLLGTYKN